MPSSIWLWSPHCADVWIFVHLAIRCYQRGIHITSQRDDESVGWVLMKMAWQANRVNGYIRADRDHLNTIQLLDCGKPVVEFHRKNQALFVDKHCDLPGRDGRDEYLAASLLLCCRSEERRVGKDCR